MHLIVQFCMERDLFLLYSSRHILSTLSYNSCNKSFFNAGTGVLLSLSMLSVHIVCYIFFLMYGSLSHHSVCASIFIAPAFVAMSSFIAEFPIIICEFCIQTVCVSFKIPYLNYFHNFSVKFESVWTWFILQPENKCCNHVMVEKVSKNFGVLYNFKYR